MNAVAIVTGAAGGIGAAIVDKFLEMGLRVCITDKNEDALNAYKATLLERFKPENFLVRALNVEHFEEIQAVEKETRTRWKRADVLVNNAGIFEMSPVLEMEESSFLKMLNVNLLGTFRTSQVFGKAMVEARHGKIINIGSIAGIRGMFQGGHYAASKAAVTALSLSMANEWAPHNVQVNVIHPGYIDTPMLTSHSEAIKVAAVWRIPAKRLGLPWEVAEAVWSLASSESSYLVGTQITIDGGISIG
ncbi:MAG: SDR family oxidoreductase [Proteobacteria bacterium]|nr:SDR family oxidoreductase [Pseudomonadota bacterium]